MVIFVSFCFFFSRNFSGGGGGFIVFFSWLGSWLCDLWDDF